MNHFERACEGVDAAIFSGDTLWDDEKRHMLKDYLARWNRAVEEHERSESQPPVQTKGLEPLAGWQLIGARSPEEYEEFRRWVAVGKPPVQPKGAPPLFQKQEAGSVPMPQNEDQAVASEPVAIHPVAKRRVLDAIRGAYDLGYNDARSARTVPGDSAPGYKGRDVEADHGGALIHSLETGPRASSSAANGLEPMSDDTKRMDWLAKRLLGADWAYGEPATCVWLIETDAGISADLRASIDAAMQSGTGGEKSNG